MKLILSQYKLIVQAFKHHNLEKKFVQGILMYHFEKKTLKNLEIFERKKKWPFFEKVTRKSNALSPKNFFFFLNDLRAQCP